MEIVAKVATAVQQTFLRLADEVAERVELIQRRRQFTGASLAQTFALGWLGNPQATVEELAQQAALAGTPVSASAVQQRFTTKLADFFRLLGAAALGRLSAAGGLLDQSSSAADGGLYHAGTAAALAVALAEAAATGGGGRTGAVGQHRTAALPVGGGACPQARPPSPLGT